MKLLALFLFNLAAFPAFAHAGDGCDGLLNTYSARNGFDQVYEHCTIAEPVTPGRHALTLALFYSAHWASRTGQTWSEWKLRDDTGALDADFIHARNAESGSTWTSELRCSGASLHVVNTSRDGQKWVGDISRSAGGTHISLRSPQHPFAVEADCD